MTVRTVGFILVLLLAAAPTWAECAWVLWEGYFAWNSGRLVYKEWVRQNALETKSACDLLLSRELEERADQHRHGANPERQPTLSPDIPADFRWRITSVRISDSSLLVHGANAKGEKLMNEHRFQCLPDTIDPRK